MYGLWGHELALGYVLFYVEGNYVSFLYHPKSRNDIPIYCQCYYALGCSTKNPNRYQLDIIEGETRKTLRFYLNFNTTAITLQFCSLADDSTTEKIISLYNNRYFIGDHVVLNKF